MPNGGAVEQHAYLAALLRRLYPHSQVADHGQRNERALDYCYVYNLWFAWNPANDPRITEETLQTLGTAIRSKARKWGVNLDYGPSQSEESPVACEASTLTPDTGILGQAANTLDDLVRTTGSLLGGVSKILPILLAIILISKVGGVVSLFGGGDRRCR